MQDFIESIVKSDKEEAYFVVPSHTRIVDGEPTKNPRYLEPNRFVNETEASYLADIRKIIPNSFLLVPGVGAQGGNLQEVCKYGMNHQVGLLINSSRGILYASKEEDFAEAATKKATELQIQMAKVLEGMSS